MEDKNSERGERKSCNVGLRRKEGCEEGEWTRTKRGREGRREGGKEGGRGKDKDEGRESVYQWQSEIRRKRI